MWMKHNIWIKPGCGGPAAPPVGGYISELSLVASEADVVSKLGHKVSQTQGSWKTTPLCPRLAFDGGDW